MRVPSATWAIGLRTGRRRGAFERFVDFVTERLRSIPICTSTILRHTNRRQ
jgi:hypothetical protein